MTHCRNYFLTSNPVTNDDGRAVLNPENGFVDALAELMPEDGPFLFIASDPDNHSMASNYAREITEAFANTGFNFPRYDLLDTQTMYEAERLVRESGVIFLAGGHVPTENAFFKRIGLRRLLQGYEGTIIGASAGSMNCADTVYACPEYPDEVTDKNYVRFIKGLGLTNTMIMPHFAELREEVRAGCRALEDVVFGDSFGKVFIGLMDGSFIVGVDGVEDICGEAYYISNGGIRPFG